MDTIRYNIKILSETANPGFIKIVKTPGQTGLPLCQEYIRRCWAIELHQTFLPGFTLPQTIKIEGLSVVRTTPRKDNFLPITELPDHQIISNKYLCRGLASIAQGHLRIFLTTLGLSDDGEIGKFGKNLSPLFRILAKGLMPYGMTEHLTSSNTFVFRGNDNNLQLAVDPDWLDFPDGQGETVLERYRNQLHIILGRIIFFNIMALRNQA